MDVDVGLGLAVHEVEADTALNFFHEDIGSSQGVLGGSQVVAAHGAGKVQGLAQLSLDQEVLVGGTGSQLTLSDDGVVNHVAEACRELADADLGDILTGDILDIGGGHGVVGVVGADVTVSAGNIGGVDLALLVPGEHGSGLGGQTDAGLAFGVLVDVDVGLGLAVHEVEADAALNLFNGHIHSVQDVVGSCQVVAAHSAGEEQGLAQFGLLQGELVGATNLRSLNKDGAAGLGGSTGNVVIEGHAVGLIAGGHSCGQLELQIFFIGVLADGDENNIVSGLADGDIFCGSIGGPSHIEALGADSDNGNDLKVTHNLAGLGIVHALDICSCISQCSGGILSGLRGGSCGGSSGRCLSRLGCGGVRGAACKHGNTHGQQQCPSSHFLHG